MAARTKSKVSPKYKTRYRVKNWPICEAALRKCGDITVWFDEDAGAAWKAVPSGCPGGQRTYSDLAIVTALTLRLVFHFALRQTEGFVASLIRLMGFDLETPDHTTLSRRNRKVELPPLAKKSDEPIHLIIDSTGLKIFGHGVGRQWRKEAGAHQQARGENGMFRYKRIIGYALRARGFDPQKREAMIGVNILNQMVALGMPESVALAT